MTGQGPRDDANVDIENIHRPRKPKRWRKRVLRVAGVLLILGVLLVAFAPTLVSTAVGTRLVLSLANTAVDGTVGVEDLKLAWSRGQHINGLELRDADGASLLKVDALEAPDLSLWSLVRGGKKLGEIKITELVCHVDQLLQFLQRGESAGPAAGQRRSAKAKPSSKRQGLPEMSVKLEIVDARLSYADDTIEKIEVAVPTAVVNVLDPRDIKVAMQANVDVALRTDADGSNAVGQITAHGNIRDLFDAAGRFRPQAGEVAGVRATVSGVSTDFFAVAMKQLAKADQGEGFLARLLRQEDALSAIVGPTLEARIEADGDLQSLNAAFEITGEHVALDGKLVGGQTLTAERPATLRWHVTQNAWSALAGAWPAMNGTELVEAFDLRASIDNLHIVVQEDGPEWARVALAFKLDVGDIVVDGGQEIGRMRLRDLNLALTSGELGRQIELVLSGAADQGDEGGKIDLRVTVENAFDANGRLNADGYQTTLVGELTGVPTAMLERFVPQISGWTDAAVGPALDVTISAVGNHQSAKCTARVESEQVSLELTAHLDAEHAIVDSGQAAMTIRPALVDKLTDVYGETLPGPLKPISLSQTARIDVEMTDLMVPLKDLSLSGATGGVVVTIDQVTPTGVDMLDRSSIGGIRVNIAKSGPEAPIDFNANVDATVDGQAATVGATGTLVGLFEPSPLLRADLVATITAPPEWLQRLKSRSDFELPEDFKALTLDQPVKADIKVTELVVPLSDFKLADVSGGVVIELQEVALGGVEMLRDMVLHHTRVEVPASKLGETLAFKAHIDVRHLRDELAVDATGSVAGLLSGSPGIDATLAVNALPVGLVEQLMNQPGKLAFMSSGKIDRLDLAVRSDPTSPDDWRFDAAIQAAGDFNVKLTGHFVPDEGLSVSEGSFAEFVVTPRAYSAWVKGGGSDKRGTESASDFKLLEPVHLKLDVQQASVGFVSRSDQKGEPASAVDVGSAAFHVRATVPAAVFAYRDGDEARRIALRDLTATLAASPLRDLASITLEGSVETQHPETAEVQISPLHSTTHLKQLFDAAGGFDIQRLRITTETGLSDVPIPLLDQLLGMGGKLSTVVGPLAVVELNGKVPGDLGVLIKSDTVDIPLMININEERQITLSEDLTASFLLTESSAETLFGDLHPVLADAVASEKPLRLMIRKDPFNLPLEQTAQNIDKLVLDMTLDIGTLRMNREGWLSQGIRGLASGAARKAKKRRTGDEDRRKTYLATFTPLRVVVRDGQLNTSEFWMTSSDMALGFQGRASLAGKEKTYKFTMGLLGASLIVEEPILINVIDPTNIYDIPVTGRIGGKPKIDEGKLYAAIGGSTLKQQLSRESQLLGEIFDAVAKDIQKKDRAKFGLQWHMPEAAKDFERTVIEQMSKGAARTSDAAGNVEEAGVDQPPAQSNAAEQEQPPSDPLERLLWEAVRRAAKKKRK